MRQLKWNEEFAIKFCKGAVKFSTPKGRGFIVRFEAEDEAKRLKEKGFTNIKIYIQKWS